MSMHEHDDFARDDGCRPPPWPRRDPLGLWALLGPESELVPISDYDGAMGCSGATAGASPATREPDASRSSACGTCTSHCPSAPLTLEHFQRSRTTEEPS
jgi:hypothetical protein